MGLPRLVMNEFQATLLLGHPCREVKKNDVVVVVVLVVSGMSGSSSLALGMGNQSNE